jgi:hypothetical protein
MGNYFQFTRQVIRQEASIDPSGDFDLRFAIWGGKERVRPA